MSLVCKSVKWWLSHFFFQLFLILLALYCHCRGARRAKSDPDFCIGKVFNQSKNAIGKKQDLEHKRKHEHDITRSKHKQNQWTNKDQTRRRLFKHWCDGKTSESNQKQCRQGNIQWCEGTRRRQDFKIKQEAQDKYKLVRKTDSHWKWTKNFTVVALNILCKWSSFSRCVHTGNVKLFAYVNQGVERTRRLFNQAVLSSSAVLRPDGG